MQHHVPVELRCGDIPCLSDIWGVAETICIRVDGKTKSKSAMDIALIFDVLVIILLIPTIILLFLLNNRLSSLRRNRGFGRLIAAFNKPPFALVDSRLRKASEDAGRVLQDVLKSVRCVTILLSCLKSGGRGGALKRCDQIPETARFSVPGDRGGYTQSEGEPLDPLRLPSRLRPLRQQLAEAAGMPVSSDRVFLLWRAWILKVLLLSLRNLSARRVIRRHLHPWDQALERDIFDPSSGKSEVQKGMRASLGELSRVEFSRDHRLRKDSRCEPGVALGDEERSEAEKDLLRALRSTQ